ncbi:MAG: HAD-IA family hydrolase [Sphaerochaetaceae bacterium]|nr:HAD-IA family hydrolase [Sphaerochaetaceae bacterium]
MIKAVLFDLDGTLFDSSPGIFHTANYTMKALGFEPCDDYKQMKKFVGPPLRECFRITYGTEEQYLDKCVEVYREEYAKTGVHMLYLYEGMKELLEKLKNRKYLTAVCTNKTEHLAKQIIVEQGLESLFDVVLGTDLKGTITKTDCIKNAVEELGITPDQALMVGDTKNDQDGAKEAGVHFCGVTYGFGFESFSEIDGFAAFSPADILDIVAEH